MFSNRSAGLTGHRAGGFTLVELLVSISLMLLTLLAVTNLYIPTKLMARTQTGVNRINENVQVISETLLREIREMGFTGCQQLSLKGGQGDDGTNASLIKSSPANGFDSTAAGIFSKVAVGDVDAPPGALAGNSIITIAHAADDGVHVLGATTDLGAAGIKVRGDPGFRVTSINPRVGVAGDCQKLYKFLIDKVEKKATGWVVVPRDLLKVNLFADARIMVLTRTQFYLANAPRGSGERSSVALFRRTMAPDGTWGAGQAVAQNVLSLKASTEIDSDGDFRADTTTALEGAYDTMQAVGLSISLKLQSSSDIAGTSATSAPIERTSRIVGTARSRVI
jgi:hypothetical protein